jgi:hypothetical protein
MAEGQRTMKWDEDRDFRNPSQADRCSQTRKVVLVMTEPAGTHIALRHTRLLLVKAGLSEDEADRFLGRISEEVVSGKEGRRGGSHL